MEKQSNEVVRTILNPFQRFFQIESSGCILLLFFTIIAITLVNSSFSDTYLNFWKNEISVSVAGFNLSASLKQWINDGLMTIFFFVAGLEIKRELMIGELSNGKKAFLPVFAAIGGMIVPAFTYVILNEDPATFKGWSIPMATDITFSLGILGLLGKRVPVSLKVFFVTFVIVSNLGAVSVMAIFNSTYIHLKYLLIGSGLFLYLVLFNLLKFRFIPVYMIFGWIIWYMFFESGIHPSLAGILIAFTIPLGRKIRINTFRKRMDSNLQEFCNDESNNKVALTDEQLAAIYNMESETKKVQSPLQSLEHRLHGPVTYFIIPVFVLANAGVILEKPDINILLHPLTASTGFSLIFGKTAGVFIFSWLAIKLKLALKPGNVKLIHIFGASLLGGMGFSISIFIAGQTFNIPELLNTAKVGIMAATFISAVLGLLILRISLKKQNRSKTVKKKTAEE
ncbi:MAG: Na+/H+ antiporter NhaA [Bacteroidales bacterium]|nr:Na+/H+ antiporter NhaA [Bacteroidales bacterium]